MSEEGVSTTKQDLKQKLSRQIDTTREKLEALKKEIAGMHDEDMEALRQKQENLRQRLDEQRAKAEQLQSDIEKWRDEKVAHTQEAIGSWRQRRELKKLQHRAERAEDYALDMVTYTAFDFDEAEQAVLDAIAARFEADTALSAASSPS
jgi:regulator of replication initiation timing